MRLADKLLLCAAGIYTALQCARILDTFHDWFFMEYFFIGIFLLLAAIGGQGGFAFFHTAAGFLLLADAVHQRVIVRLKG